MRELLIASGNPGKVKEMFKALIGAPVAFLTLQDVDAGGEVEETGATLEENAILKAKTYGERTGKLTIADDSGLEVDALDGRPGVQSARYAEGDDVARNAKLLGELQNVPDDKRTAKFRAVIAIYDPVKKLVRTCEGSSTGHIMKEPRGGEGFGYDPVFYYEDAKKTGGEMTREEKNQISHRGRALQKAREILKEFL